MHLHLQLRWCPVLLLLLPSVSALIQVRHQHTHQVLNETDILQSHAPDPVSYWEHDFVNHDTNVVPGLMFMHVLGMLFAFFILLPVAIALRSVRNTFQGPVFASFTIIAFLSAAAGSLYKKLTGDLYQGSVHGKLGYVVLGLALVLILSDVLSLLRRAYYFLRSPHPKSFRLLCSSLFSKPDPAISSHEYTALVNHAHDNRDDDEYMQAKFESDDADVEQSRQPDQRPDHTRGPTSEWVNRQEWTHPVPTALANATNNFHIPRYSDASDETLHNPTLSRVQSHDTIDHHPGTRERPWRTRAYYIAIATAERVLLLLAFTQLLSGITVYTGICRGNYMNGCMAHLIKGGIFWCYGLLSFGRYLGAWADLGWAWNRLPSRRAQKIPTAEAVESGVIFLYGITNTWMERFGAEPGSPFTTKQIQHISIAVMFWFAGLLGLALESKNFRRWLASPARSVIRSEDTVSLPPSYTGSFNPFPALVIGVTGAAMSAHHQTYQFQVQIHALWGLFLTAFAVLRFFTYFFLWLRPPHSVLPSRPPTEALASFCLATGGFVFILSTEQITFAAMRRGHDDVMFFFNFGVAVTSLLFCWLLSLTAFKGWLSSRATHITHSSRRVVFDAEVNVL